MPMDPSSEFAVSVAVGAHVLGSVLDSLARATRSAVAAALVALPVLAAYLSAVTLAFAVRAAADCYARVVDAAAVAQQATAGILGWVANVVLRIAFRALLFGAIAVACALLSAQFTD